MESHLAFSLARTAVQGLVLIPKYYDPELELANEAASEHYHLPRLGDILLSGAEGSQLGTWIRREWYGTGEIPYVRTSDLSHWRIRPDFKKGVAREVFESVKHRQDIRVNDILMVAHGTYLVGTVAIVTSDDPEMILQDHLFRLRVKPSSHIHPYLLLASLSTSFVRRQVRARQFSADIIDKIGERHLELRIPIPKSQKVIDDVVEQVGTILQNQVESRREMQRLSGTNLRLIRERAASHHGFSLPRSVIRNRILIPKYYDPLIQDELEQEEALAGEPWVSIGDLVGQGYITLNTGVEVGKMAYGTGPVPFIRTSDIADWEIKRDVKHSVSESVYKRYLNKAGVEAGDILLVRDGTYLVGSSALVSSDDEPALISGGIFRLRVRDPDLCNPAALLAFLNFPVVRKQMRARQFTRDVIDTLGQRITEVKIPSPFSRAANDLGRSVLAIMLAKSETKRLTDTTIELVEPSIPPVAKGRPGWSMR